MAKTIDVNGKEVTVEKALIFYFDRIPTGGDIHGTKVAMKAKGYDITDKCFFYESGGKKRGYFVATYEKIRKEDGKGGGKKKLR